MSDRTAKGIIILCITLLSASVFYTYKQYRCQLRAEQEIHQYWLTHQAYPAACTNDDRVPVPSR